MNMAKYLRKILALAVLLLFFMQNMALAATPKTVVARVSSAGGSPPYPADAGITIVVTEGHGETATYSSGNDPDLVIDYDGAATGVITILMGNFDNEWAAGDTLTIDVLSGSEAGGTTTTQDSSTDQRYPAAGGQ